MSVVLVTGAGTGIGAAVTEVLTASGASVVVCGRRREPLEAVSANTGALPVVADVSTVDGVRAVVDVAVSHFGALDALVLNAGVVRAGTLEELTVEDWEETMRINLTGPFLLAKEALPHLLQAGGSIVAVGSVAGLRAAPAYAAYGASKAGLHMFVQDLAVDLGPRGVRVNCVAPGWVRTEMADAEMAEFGEARGLNQEQAYAAVTAAVPQRRAAAPREVAEAVAWLLSAQASYVNGAVLSVDGGTAVVDAGSLAFLS